MITIRRLHDEKRCIPRALVFVLFGLTLGAFWDGSSTDAQTAYSLTASPTTIDPGLTITVTWSAPSGHSDTDWIGIYPTSYEDRAYGTYYYTGTATSGTMTFLAPSTAGSYDFRYFTDGGYNKVATIPVTVSPSYSVTPNPSIVDPGATITVTWNAPAGHSGTDWVGIYPSSYADTQYGVYYYTGTAISGTMTFTASSTAGDYDFRYFTNGGYNKVATSPIIVSPKYSITATPNPVAPNGTLTVTWTAPVGHTGSDWIGIYPVATVDTQYGVYYYTSTNTSGTMTFTAPSTPGDYNFRFFTNGGYNKVGTSPFTVNATYSITTTPLQIVSGNAINLSWTAPSGHSDSDWIGIYLVGAADTSYTEYYYTGTATSGTMTFTAPSTTGSYEFRYFTNGGYNKMATSPGLSEVIPTQTTRKWNSYVSTLGYYWYDEFHPWCGIDVTIQVPQSLPSVTGSNSVHASGAMSAYNGIIKVGIVTMSNQARLWRQDPFYDSDTGNPQVLLPGQKIRTGVGCCYNANGIQTETGPLDYWGEWWTEDPSGILPWHFIAEMSVQRMGGRAGVAKQWMDVKGNEADPPAVPPIYFTSPQLYSYLASGSTFYGQPNPTFCARYHGVNRWETTLAISEYPHSELPYDGHWDPSLMFWWGFMHNHVKN